MREPVPQGIVHTDQERDKFQSDIASNAGKIVGKPLTAAHVNPDDQSSLKNIENFVGDMTHDATHIVSTISGDEETKIRIAQQKVPIAIRTGRWLKKQLLERKAA